MTDPTIFGSLIKLGPIEFVACILTLTMSPALYPKVLVKTLISIGEQAVAVTIEA